MVRAIIFELDALLGESRRADSLAFCDALRRVEQACVHLEDEHLATPEALPALRRHGEPVGDAQLPRQDRYVGWRLKQEFTSGMLRSIKSSPVIRETLVALRRCGLQLYCVADCPRSVAEVLLAAAELIGLLDGHLSTGDVGRPQPAPDVYLKWFLTVGLDPQECLVVVNSPAGQESARRAGARVMWVSGQDRLLGGITRRLERSGSERGPALRWDGGDMNVLIPMAGEGSRFRRAGFDPPKPLIDVCGKPMIQVVVENLNLDCRHVFLARREHVRDYNLNTVLPLLAPGCEIVPVDGATGGAACTTLLAKHLIADAPLLIANADQYLEWDGGEFLFAMSSPSVDAGMLTFEADDPKWSFAEVGPDQLVKRVAEKEPISRDATAGVYYWTRGGDYVRAAERMIERGRCVNGEYYVCPAFNEAIEDGARVRTFAARRMWGLGTPEDLQAFLEAGPCAPRG